MGESQAAAVASQDSLPPADDHPEQSELVVAPETEGRIFGTWCYGNGLQYTIDEDDVGRLNFHQKYGDTMWVGQLAEVSEDDREWLVASLPHGTIRLRLGDGVVLSQFKQTGETVWEDVITARQATQQLQDSAASGETGHGRGMVSRVRSIFGNLRSFISRHGQSSHSAHEAMVDSDEAQYYHALEAAPASDGLAAVDAPPALDMLAALCASASVGAVVDAPDVAGAVDAAFAVGPAALVDELNEQMEVDEPSVEERGAKESSAPEEPAAPAVGELDLQDKDVEGEVLAVEESTEGADLDVGGESMASLGEPRADAGIDVSSGEVGFSEDFGEGDDAILKAAAGDTKKGALAVVPAVDPVFRRPVARPLKTKKMGSSKTSADSTALVPKGKNFQEYMQQAQRAQCYHIVTVDVDRYPCTPSASSRPHRHRFPELCRWMGEKVVYDRKPDNLGPTARYVMIAQKSLVAKTGKQAAPLTDIQTKADCAALQCCPSSPEVEPLPLEDELVQSDKMDTPPKKRAPRGLGRRPAARAGRSGGPARARAVSDAPKADQHDMGAAKRRRISLAADEKKVSEETAPYALLPGYIQVPLAEGSKYPCELFVGETHGTITSGAMRIPPESCSSVDRLPEGTTFYFNVLATAYVVKLQLDGADFHVREGDRFIVAPGQAYSLKNDSKDGYAHLRMVIVSSELAVS